MDGYFLGKTGCTIKAARAIYGQHQFFPQNAGNQGVESILLLDS
jgi:hypothetical protein